MGVGEQEQEWIIPFPKFENGKGMEKTIPKIQKREGNEKKPFPKFGNGKGMKKSIPIIRERELEAFILGNGREREFPLTPADSAFFVCRFNSCIVLAGLSFQKALSALQQFNLKQNTMHHSLARPRISPVRGGEQKTFSLSNSLCVHDQGWRAVSSMNM